MGIKCRRPGLRETRYPDLPPFRGSGRQVSQPLLRVITNNQRRWGVCIASEAGLRHMIAEDEELMPGVSTIPKALDRLEANGIAMHRPLGKGKVMPDGSGTAHSGTTLSWVPQSRHEKRALKIRAKHAQKVRQNAREANRERRDPDPYRVVPTLSAAVDRFKKEVEKAFAPGVPPATAAASERERKEEAKRQLALWAAQSGWKDPDKPPDE